MTVAVDGAHSRTGKVGAIKEPTMAHTGNKSINTSLKKKVPIKTHSQQETIPYKNTLTSDNKEYPPSLLEDTPNRARHMGSFLDNSTLHYDQLTCAYKTHTHTHI